MSNFSDLIYKNDEKIVHDLLILFAKELSENISKRDNFRLKGQRNGVVVNMHARYAIGNIFNLGITIKSPTLRIDFALKVEPNWIHKNDGGNIWEYNNRAFFYHPEHTQISDYDEVETLDEWWDKLKPVVVKKMLAL